MLQADTRETLRQILIKEHYFDYGKAPSLIQHRVWISLARYSSWRSIRKIARILTA
jgi:hypothetical protein